MMYYIGSGGLPGTVHVFLSFLRDLRYYELVRGKYGGPVMETAHHIFLYD